MRTTVLFTAAILLLLAFTNTPLHRSEGTPPDEPGSASGPQGGSRFEMRMLTPGSGTLGGPTVHIGEHLVLSDGTFTITGTITVEGGAVLTVSNATLIFDGTTPGSAGIRVEPLGRLFLRDSTLRPVSALESWALSIMGSVRGEDATVNGTDGGAVLDGASEADFEGCTFMESIGPGVSALGCDVRLQNSTFTDNTGTDLWLGDGATVRSFGHTGSGETANITSNSSRVELGGYLRVRVLGPEEEPLSGAEVTVRDVRDVVVARAYTGGDGATPFIPLVTDSAVSARGARWTSHEPFNIVAFDEQWGVNSTDTKIGAKKTLTFGLDGTCRPTSESAFLEGYIFDMKGTALEGVPVSARFIFMENGSHGGTECYPGDASTVSGPDGYYLLEVLPPGCAYESVIWGAGDGWRFNISLGQKELIFGDLVKQDFRVSQNPFPFAATVVKDGQRVPLDGASNVSTETDIRIVFDSSVDPMSLEVGLVFRSTSNEYAVAGNEEGIIDVNITYNEPSHTAILEPVETLKGDIAFSTEHIPYFLDITPKLRNASNGGPAVWETWTGQFDTSYPDSDGDGHSDRYDWFPYDATQQVDSDEDGYGDNQSGNNPDAFPYEMTQWSDRDGDGYGDNSGGADPDVFPDDPGAHGDNDGDGMPDELVGASYTGLVADPDDDNDGLSDEREKELGTDPKNADTDGDLVPDKDDPAPTNPSVWDDDGIKVVDDGDDGGDDGDDDNEMLMTMAFIFFVALVLSLFLIRVVVGRRE